jgi:hypothetical protein
MTDALNALGLPLAMLALLVLAQLLPLYRYAFDDNGFSVRFLGLLVTRIRYSDIVVAREAKWSDLAALPARYVHRPMDRYIYVELRSGVFRRVVITPPDLSGFAQHLASAGVKTSLPNVT